MTSKVLKALARRSATVGLWVAVGAAACAPGATSMDQARLTELGTIYAAAWSSQDPDRLAGFYAEDGVLQVNAGDPSVGRAAVRATAEGFMTAFPDMVVRMDSMIPTPTGAVFHWTWTGTNTGPGGTGHAVHLTGYEEWTLGPDGLIHRSLGHFDESEYQRQVTGDGLPVKP